MNREKLGAAISTAVSTFLTVYVALRIGKAIGRREVVIETLSDDIDRWRERIYPKSKKGEPWDTLDNIELRAEDQEPDSFGAYLAEKFADERKTTPPKWWEQPIVYRSIIGGVIGIILGLSLGTIASALL